MKQKYRKQQRRDAFMQNPALVPEDHSTPAAFILKCMRLSEERGAYHVLATRFRENDAELQATATPEELIEYEQLKERAASAFAFEQVHGHGSLLRMDHPLNRELITTGVMKFSQIIRPVGVPGSGA
jgi:hypothetical protein